jgi:hypothetical protein
MTPTCSRQIRRNVVLTIVVALWAGLAGCASVGPIRPTVVADLASVRGTWGGTVYLRGSERNDVTVTIASDDTYDVESVKQFGVSRGRGYVAVSDGRLVIAGERGRGTGTLLRSSSGEVVMRVEMTLSDNSQLSAQLSRTDRHIPTKLCPHADGRASSPPR